MADDSIATALLRRFVARAPSAEAAANRWPRKTRLLLILGASTALWWMIAIAVAGLLPFLA